MRFAVTIENEPLDDLVTRVYDFGGKPSATQLRSARKAVTDANPYLRKLSTVPAGTVLTVPELDDAQPSAQTQEAAPLLGGIVLEQLRGALALASDQLESDLGGEIAAARTSIKLIGSSDVKQLRRDDPALVEALPHLSKAASARVEDAQALQRYQKAVLAQVERDLAALTGG